jgi:hypothetical protein
VWYIFSLPVPGEIPVHVGVVHLADEEPGCAVQSHAHFPHVLLGGKVPNGGCNKKINLSSVLPAPGLMFTVRSAKLSIDYLLSL